ncbi:hypothetical protein Tco_1030813 [Tanacetum coccineum]|uniref:Uncharacterized protein n=1 Tax=Tanacetum coccineum TaxID=301880 RepID=A0ABQ5G9J4_9ASTR
MLIETEEPKETKVQAQEPEVQARGPQVIQVVLIRSINPTTSITPKVQVIEISSKPSHTNLIIDITPPKDQPESSSFITPRVNKGKGIARDTDDSPPKLVKALRKVRPDHDAPILVEYEIDEQDPSLPKRKRKAIELEPKTYIVGLHYNRLLPKGVEFVKNLVIENLEHGLFFIDSFGEEAF